MLQRIVSALILSHIDYCNALLTGLSRSVLAPLRIMHIAAGIMAELGPQDHVTKSMKVMHWLPV